MGIAGRRPPYDEGDGLLDGDHPAHATSDNSATQAEVAEYISEITGEIAAMASEAKLDMLAYFLTMARLEAELKARDIRVQQELRAQQELLQVDRLQTKSASPRPRKARVGKLSG